MYTAQGKINQQEVLQQYLPMVRRQALGLKTRLPSNIELDDLIQAGSIGLLDAMTRYDVSVGATFATFASQRIRGAMIDELRTRDWCPAACAVTRGRWRTPCTAWSRISGGRRGSGKSLRPWA